MPAYNYRCRGCDHLFSQVLKIADRKNPESEVCPECKANDTVYLTIEGVRIVSGVGDFQAKVSNNFKDRLKEINKMAGKQSKMQLA